MNGDATRVASAGLAGRVGLVSFLLALSACGGPGEERAPDRTNREPLRNVLLIAVDDLRPALGAYGDPLAHTPNLDALARESVTFRRAYSQQPLCNPSRTSVLTGLLPVTTGVHDLTQNFRERLPAAVTLPQLFRQAGFVTRAVGKVHHGTGALDDALSWSERPWHPKLGTFVTYASEEGRRVQREVREAKKRGHWLRGLPAEAPEVPDSRLVDGRILEEALRVLEAVRHERFFLAVGFRKPHLPFVAPKRYWDLFPPEAVDWPPTGRPPRGAPRFSTTPSHELRNYAGIPPSGPIGRERELELVRGYYACVAYVDALIGRLLDALREHGLWDETAIVFWSDHGFHLGELGMWGKGALFEESTRAPLIVRAPGMPGNGGRSDAIVELLDIYPTLADLFELAPPPDLEGRSRVPLLEDPDRPSEGTARSQYPRDLPNLGKQRIGTSLRTERYRLTRWTQDGEQQAIELYDYAADPAGSVNIASDPAAAEVLDSLLALLDSSR